MQDSSTNNHQSQPDGESLAVIPVAGEVLPPGQAHSERPSHIRYCTGHRTNGEPCGAFAVKESRTQKCAKHGGLAPGRPVETARFSEFLPKRLRERQEQFENDPNYVALRGQIGVISTRLSELLERIGRGDSRKRREDIKESLDSLVAHLDADLLSAETLLPMDLDDPDVDPRDVLARAHKVLDAGRTIRLRLLELQADADTEVRQDQCWDDVDRFSESLRKLKETEVKRMVAANQVLTVTESYNLITRLVQVIEEYLDDKEIRARAVRELYQLLERRGSK